MATTERSGKKVALLSFWRSHQVLQQGTLLPLEGFAPAGARVRVLFLRYTEGGEPICLFSHELQADMHGQFKSQIEVPLFEGDAFRYALIVQAQEPGRAFAGYRHLLQADGSYEVVLRDLCIGDVWLILGCQQTFVPIRSYWLEEEYDRVIPDPLLRFASIPAQQEQPLHWKEWKGETLDSLPLLLYYFLLQLRQLHPKLPIGVVYPEVEAEDTLPFATWLPGADGFNRYLKRISGLGLRGIVAQPDERTCAQLSAFQEQLQLGVDAMEEWGTAPQREMLCWIFSHFRVLPQSLRQMGETVRPILLANQILSDFTERLNRPCTVLPVYDLPLLYQPPQGEGDPNLPLDRRQEGKRLAQLASTLAAGQRSQLPPRCVRIQRQNAGFVLTFSGFSGTLSPPHSEGEGVRPLTGFYLAERGYPPRPARAQLLARDRVYVHHPDIHDPYTCLYAYLPWALDANLVSDCGMPALPFVVGDWHGVANPLLWTRFDQAFQWGIQSLKEHSPRAFPSDLPLRKYGSGVRAQEAWDPRLGGWVLNVEYRLLHENQKHHALGDWIDLWSPAGPYVYPKQPVWAGYRILTALVSNPDARPKQLRLGQGRVYTLPANVQSFPVSFPLPSVSGVEGVTRSLFSVCDTGNLRDQGKGRLRFAQVELWQNERIAEEWIRQRNLRGVALYE